MFFGDDVGNTIQGFEEIRQYVAFAQDGRCPKEDITDYIEKINARIQKNDDAVERLRDILAAMDMAGQAEHGSKLLELVDEYGSSDQIQARIDAMGKESRILNGFVDTLQELLPSGKNFNKNLCFSNIRELLKRNPNVKIGQIEKEAGIRLGYMSRLEKEGNTAEPSMEFIITAAKLLNVSIDTLVTVDLAGLTPHEQYITKFFDKLKSDTLADKLDWKRETAFVLNNMESDINGCTDHPLFSLETFTEEINEGDSEEVTKVVFQSKSFGFNTHIKDDCFNLRLKNGTVLYLMNVSRSVYRVGDPNAAAIEVWLYVPRTDCSVLVSSRDKTQVAPMSVSLYQTVKTQMEHPKINKGALSAIDAFMKDDLEDDKFDDGDDIPF